MPTTSEYLSDLVEQKNTLADNINNNGVSASQEETLNTLVPKVNNVYTKGVEDGVQYEYDKFWDAFQNYGNRKFYSHAFQEDSSHRAWSTGFTPKYPIKCDVFQSYMFQQFNVASTTPIDFTEFCKVNNIRFSYNNIEVDYIRIGTYGFSSANVSRLPKIKVDQLNYNFQNCQKLETIDELEILSTTSAMDGFGNCKLLKNVTFTGSVKCSSVSFTQNPLITVETMLSLFYALYDYSESTTTYKVYLGTTNLNKLTDEEKAIATNKNWTLA